MTFWIVLNLVFLSLLFTTTLILGWYGHRRTVNTDSYVTARSSYGPGLLALSYAASAVSGSTYLGMPGLAYKLGISMLWLIPASILGFGLGMLLSTRLLFRYGLEHRSRTIGEFLGSYYDSQRLRQIVGLFSLLLIAYLTGQMMGAAVLLKATFGLQTVAAVLITVVVLAGYLVFGGAHADILTDAAQAVVMLVISVSVFAVFCYEIAGFGSSHSLLDRLAEIDPHLSQPLSSKNPLIHSPWSLLFIVLANVPFGLLPHMSPRVWALKHREDLHKFIGISSVLIMLASLVLVGGLVARAAGIEVGALEGNVVLPRLLRQLLPLPIAAMACSAILAAIISTADGLSLAVSQGVVNDLIRPRYALSQSVGDKKLLAISRLMVVLVLAIGSVLVIVFVGTNITLFVWMGAGGLMSALFGPIFWAACGLRLSAAAAIIGFLAGLLVFVGLHSGVLGWLLSLPEWMVKQGGNPFFCASFGAVSSVSVMALGLLKK